MPALGAAHGRRSIGGYRMSQRESEDSTAELAPGPARSELMLVPHLTVIAHPDPERVGTRASLLEASSGRRVALSRSSPRFAPPGGQAQAALEDRGVSRTPIWICAGGAAGWLRLVRGDSPMAVQVDGEALEDGRELSTDELARGVVVLLAERVALVMHLGDAVPSWSRGRYGLRGESSKLHRLQRRIEQVAALEVPVLIRGESGAGKELVARAIHEASGRRAQPYVAVNMAAIPPALAAAELFGAARGAFTGAEGDRPGYFSRAHGGTLFLDEIGEAAPEVQALLLRALESGEVQKVGSAAVQRADVRVIAATDADLPAMVAAARFRGPLLHRLMAASVTVPALRERREDFGRLLYGFVREELEAARGSSQGSPESERLRAGVASERPWLEAPLVAELARLRWPGNVRQLRNCARAMVAVARAAPSVQAGDVEELLREVATDADAPTGSGEVGGEARATLRSPRLVAGGEKRSAPRRGYRAASEVGEEELLAALHRHQWRLAATAAALGVSRTSLYARIERSPRVHKGSDLSLDEIEAALARRDGDLDAAVAELGVSRHGLLLRLRELRKPRGAGAAEEERS